MTPPPTTHPDPAGIAPSGPAAPPAAPTPPAASAPRTQPAPTPQRLTDLASAAAAAESLIRTGERRILGIVGPPGAGKSTVGARILDSLGPRAALVPMDGFHFSQSELVRRGRRDRMGAPDTFDVPGFAALLARLRDRGEDCVHAPRFDRTIEEPIAGALAIPASADLVITEGNYLLHDGDGWDRVAPHLDVVWYLEVPTPLREERLVRRRIEHGDDPEHSLDWVRTVDARNAALVEATRDRADAILDLEELR